MPTVPIKAFDGLSPKVSPRLLPDGKAQIAQEVLLESGKIVPLKALSASVLTITAGTKTIWRFGNDDTPAASWMTFTQDASVIQSPVFDDANKRLYWTLDETPTTPKYAPSGSLFSGGLGPTGTTYTLGIPAPATAPTANPAGMTTVTSANWDYMVTYTYSGGDSDPSPKVTVKAVAARGANWTTYPVQLSNLPVPETPAMYTGKKIWAKLASGSTWNLVASVGISDTEYTDNVNSLGAAYSSTTANIAAVPKPAAPIASITAPLDLKTSTSTQYYVAYYAPAVLDMNPGTEPGAQYDVNRVAAVGLLSAAMTQSVDDSQTVTITIPAAATSAAPAESLYITAVGFAVFRRRPTDAEPMMIGWEPFNRSSPAQITFADANRTATMRYSDISNWAYSIYAGPNIWNAPTGCSSSISASTAHTLATRVFYQYCLTFKQGSTNGRRSDASEIVGVSEADTDPGGGVSMVRQQGVRLTFDAAPAGMTAEVYRRTVTITLGNTGTGSTVNETSGYKLLISLAAGIGQYVDNRINDLATTALPSTSDLTVPEGPTSTFGAVSSVPAPPATETRGYCYTYVTTYGEEGPPSPVSALIDTNPSASPSATLTGLPKSATIPGGYANITKFNLYRSNAGTSSAAFQFVAQVTIGAATDTYNDTVAASALGEVLPSENWDAPPTNLIGLCMGGNGIAAGFTKATGDGTSELYFSEPYLPHAWPVQYKKSTGTKVVAMIPFGGNAWGVLTTNYPYVAVGTDPMSISLEKIAQPQACVNKRSAVATDNGVIYASPDGLCLLNQTGVQVVSENLLTRAQWQAYSPTTMFTRVHNGRVLVFYTATVDGVAGGVLIFDFTGKSAILTRSSLTATGGFYDAISDQLYLVNGNTIVKWIGGSDRSWTWRSKIYSLPQPTSFAWMQVEADAYPVTVKFYIGGTANASVPDGTQLAISSGGAAWTVSVGRRDPYRMPAWIMYRDLEIEMTGAVTVHSVAVSHTSQELAQV